RAEEGVGLAHAEGGEVDHRAAPGRPGEDGGVGDDAVGEEDVARGLALLVAGGAGGEVGPDEGDALVAAAPLGVLVAVLDAGGGEAAREGQPDEEVLALVLAGERGEDLAGLLVDIEVVHRLAVDVLDLLVALDDLLERG